MKCKRVMELLLTEYIDERLNEKENLEVKNHLESCQGCRDYYNLINKEVVAPLRNAREVTPSEEVWQGIRNKIIERKLAAQNEGILARIKDTLALRKPVMALISVILILAIFSGIKISEHASYITVRNYIQEKMTLVGETENDTETFNGNGFGTSIEEFLL